MEDVKPTLSLKKLARSLNKKLEALHKEHFGHSNSFKITKEIVKTCPFEFNFALYSNKKPEQRWQFIKDLRDATNREWSKRMEDGDIAQVAKLAEWVVVNTGGIRSNKEETILRYTEKAAAYGFVDKHDGISSYSKVLSAMDRSKYQIYDTRVASCLNILQLEYFGGRRFYFDVGGARNSDVKLFNKIYPKKKFLEIGFKLPKKELKLHDFDYFRHLINRMAREARAEPLDIEMMLFDYVLPLVKDLTTIEAKYQNNVEWKARQDEYWRKRKDEKRKANSKFLQ